MLRKFLIVIAGSGTLAVAGAQTWQPAGVQPIPPGAVMYFAVQACPAGWLEANGSPISQSAYPKLYAAVGAVLPDLRGEFIRGWDHGRSVDPGRAFGSYQGDDIKAHTHNHPGMAAALPGTIPVLTGSGSAAVPTSSTGGMETRPRNMALLVCIKT